ncbi:MAG: Hpt domain-containing protein [Candidatus Dormibacteria bacterium]
MRSRVVALREALTNGDALAIRDLAHSLKGSSGSLGQWQLTTAVNNCRWQPPQRISTPPRNS